MAMNKRLQREFQEMQTNGVKSFEGLKVDESNFYVWEGLITPEKPPYNKGAFRIQITFPRDYPFKPPTVLFKTKIYHPNIDENGQVCLGIISTENWKPATRVEAVISGLVKLINDPEHEHPQRADIAEEFDKNKKKFMKSAEEHTKKYAEKRE